MMSLSRSGFLLVLSSPSGAGKTTLAKMVALECDDISLSISVTTRPPRAGECDGIDYRFASKEQFETWKKDNCFLEWANVFGHLYGTLREDVDAHLQKGCDVLFDIDWQGMRSLRQLMPTQTVSVFIFPPSFEDLSTRLTARGDTPTMVAARMQKAHAEMSHASEYDYIIVNDQLADSLQALKHILYAERLKQSRLLNFPVFGL